MDVCPPNTSCTSDTITVPPPAASQQSLSLVLFYLSILVVPGLLFSSFRQLQKRLNPTAAAGNADKTKPPAFPGPKQYPVVGRVHDLDRMGMWLKFKEWADEFGPIYQTSMLGQKFIVISEESIAQELLVKNGNNFAGRPQIRALIDHKLGPVYSALMDRHGRSHKNKAAMYPRSVG